MSKPAPREWQLIYSDGHLIAADCSEAPDNGSYSLVERTPTVAAAGEAIALLRSLIEVGKRDLTNPKYDSYFDDANELLARLRREAGR